MRTGACTVQQTFTAEAASVLKHSLNLARRRGHAQVTPLHVAATLLTCRSSLLKRACLKSQNQQPQPQQQQQQQLQFPLQGRALELCFNVALNRLPTTPGTMFHGQPSLSNALIAALKRAQAHQRRGCIEQQQQQPLLTVKVELEQLVVSILDDPSVSRVMREAGFSSTVVKTNIEDCSSVFYSSSGGVFSTPCSPSNSETLREKIINPSLWQTHFSSSSFEQNPFTKKPPINYFTSDLGFSIKEDVKLVFDVFLGKRKKNGVVVGDSLSVTEGVVSEIMSKIERGDVREELKNTHFIKFQFLPVALKFMKKDDIETSVSELKRKVDSLVSCGKSVIVYVGDLKWIVNEDDDSNSLLSSSCCYSPVDHLVVEIGRLVFKYDTNETSMKKVWFLGTSSYQTYMRCQMRQPPLDLQWMLQAVSVPSGGLGLSLNASSGLSKATIGTKEELNCCPECNSYYEKEAQSFKSAQQKVLPLWLQPDGDNTNQKDALLGLRRKWNRFCNSLHRSQFGLTMFDKSKSLWPTTTNQSGVFPDSNPISFTDSVSKPKQSSFNSVAKFRRQNSCTIEFNSGNDRHRNQTCDQKFESFKRSEDKEENLTLALGHTLSDSEKIEKTEQQNQLLSVLRGTVALQCQIPSSIVAELVASENDTWILVQGNDTERKRRLAKVISENIFGSGDFVVQINMKRKESNCCQVLTDCLKNQENVVALIENVDFANSQFTKLLDEEFKIGNFAELSKKIKRKNKRVIFILTEGDSEVNERQNGDFVMPMTLKIKERGVGFTTQNSDHKRKLEWDLSNRIKKKDFSWKSSFNTLDLNMKAEDYDEEEKSGELSSISSDLSPKISLEHRKLKELLDLIQNRLILDWQPDIKDVILGKIKGCFNDVFVLGDMVSFSVEEKVIEELVGVVITTNGEFNNSLVEKWLKDIFQPILEKKVKIGGIEGGKGVIRLCFGGIDEKMVGEGFMGTCLPKKIQICFME